MTTLTAVPDPQNASVNLEIIKTSPVTRVLRSDANGIAEVRGLAGQFPSLGTGTLILTDYEAASGAVSYTVFDEGAGAEVNTSLTLNSPWLFLPILPNYSVPVTTITDYQSGQTTRSTVHQILGRADPVLSMGRLSMRTGTLEIFCPTLAHARALSGVFDRGEIVMLRQNVESMDMYFTAENVDVAPYSVEGEQQTNYRFTVSYVEVARPIGALQGALGWNFEELAAAYPSFDAVVAAFATFDDLTLREEK